MDNATASGDAIAAGVDQTATLAVGGLVIVLALFTVILRFFTRVSSKAGLGWDDWLILAGVVMALFIAALLVWGKASLSLSSSLDARQGSDSISKANGRWNNAGSSEDPNGTSISENTDPNYVYTPKDVLYIKLSFIASVLYFNIAGSTKLGILLMYHRLFKMNKTFRRQLVAAGFLVIAWWIGCTVATLTNCIPLEWTWLNALDDPRYCFNFNIFWMVSGACEVLIDIAVLSLPIQVILALQMSRRKKATVAFIFLLGGFVIVTGLVKTILGYAPGKREPSYSRTEVWTVIHAGMANICASLPLFKPLIARISQSTLFTGLLSLSSRHRVAFSNDSPSSSKSESRRIGSPEMKQCEILSETELRGVDVY